MWLALDTATDRATVALGERAEDAVVESLPGARRHAAALIPMIESVLRQAGATLDQVEGVIVADGPGSFTGLRVAAAAAKALVHARGIELWAAPSLMARAAGASAASDGAGLTLAVSDALRGQVFAAGYRFSPGAVITELAPAVWSLESLMAEPVQPDLVTGDAPADVMAALARWSGRGPVVSPPVDPPARFLLDLRARRGGAIRVGDPLDWEPVYGRPAEAQARWEIAHGRPLPDSRGGPG